MSDVTEMEPALAVLGFKKNTDGSTTFKLHKGPYDKHKVRIYPSQTDATDTFPRAIYSHPELGVVVYALHPPIRKAGKWVYAYQEDDKSPQTDAERGIVDWSDTAQQQWLAHGRWKRVDDERRLREMDASERQPAKRPPMRVRDAPAAVEAKVDGRIDWRSMTIREQFPWTRPLQIGPLEDEMTHQPDDES